MRLLKLTTARLLVQRTGLPFYDAARVIGVAQLFFGTSRATARETGFGWQIEGVINPDDRKVATHRLWIGERLRRFERKPNNYMRLMKWLAVPEKDGQQEGEAPLIAKWPLLQAYFADPAAARKIGQENTTGLMDSALALGGRGLDPTRYGDFAAESGTASQQPEAETLVALLGLSHAARVNNAMYLLPIFGSLNAPDQAETYPITTARYWNYNRYFAHEGGERIAATWAMLSMLESLFDAGLPVQDFAYNRADRPIYHSGTLGAERLCRLWQRCPGVLTEIGRFLQATQREKGGHCADLARALAEFALIPDAHGLERVVRLKARAMADEDNRANSLLRQPDTIKEIGTMLKQELPELPENLCRTVWSALDTTDKGWIGRYLKLENAGTPERFIEEIERLVSRAKIRSESKSSVRSVNYFETQGEKPLIELIGDLKNPRVFRAFRAVFLLKVLQIPTKNKAEATPENNNVASAPDGVVPTDTPELDPQQENNQ